MPTYVYACDSCGNQFERFQSFKDEPLQTCPSCASAVRRVFQPVGIVFKGSGWYVTDSRKSNSATVSGDDSAGKAEKVPAGDNAAKSEAKSEAKSDAKSEAKSDAKSEPAAKSEPKSETKSSSESKPAT
jgi:putative FmdB family regulatory protein